MNKNALGSARPSVAITFAAWRRAPLLWSAWILGRALVKASDATLECGLRLMDWADARLHGGAE